MATEVIHEHHAHSGSNNSGLIVGIIAVAAFLLLALFLFQGGFNLGFLGGQSTAPQVNVPDKVDVNVNK